jgi:hypothetical protein
MKLTLTYVHTHIPYLLKPRGRQSGQLALTYLLYFPILLFFLDLLDNQTESVGVGGGERVNTKQVKPNKTCNPNYRFGLL